MFFCRENGSKLSNANRMCTLLGYYGNFSPTLQMATSTQSAAIFLLLPDTFRSSAQGELQGRNMLLFLGNYMVQEALHSRLNQCTSASCCRGEEREYYGINPTGEAGLSQWPGLGSLWCSNTDSCLAFLLSIAIRL